MNLAAACKAFIDAAFPKRTEAQRLEAERRLAFADWKEAKARHQRAEEIGDTREMGRARMDMARANRRQLDAGYALRNASRGSLKMAVGR